MKNDEWLKKFGVQTPLYIIFTFFFLILKDLAKQALSIQNQTTRAMQSDPKPFHPQKPLLSVYGMEKVNPLPDDKILDWSKLKQIADDNFEFDVNRRKFSQLVENTLGKGEIARYEQFLLFPQCFQKACFPRVSKGVVVWEWVKTLDRYL